MCTQQTKGQQAASLLTATGHFLHKGGTRSTVDGVKNMAFQRPAHHACKEPNHAWNKNAHRPCAHGRPESMQQ
eukprot:1159716-Pelagomonas_calceolata.AAC.1